MARRGLVFEGFFKVGGALTQFAQEPRVLHCDDRLCGEILQQRDLLIGERAYLSARDSERSYNNIVLEQRDCEVASGATEFDWRGSPPVSRSVHLVRRQIWGRDKLPCAHYATQRRIGTGSVRLTHKLCQRRRHIANCYCMEALAVIGPQTAGCRLA